jgi:hypothetical protein
MIGPEMLLLSIHTVNGPVFNLSSFRVEVKMAVNIRVKVHPVVLFQIADSYERRSQDNHRQAILLVSTKVSTGTLFDMKVLVLRIREISVQIRGSIPLTSGSGSCYFRQ